MALVGSRVGIGCKVIHLVRGWSDTDNSSFILEGIATVIVGCLAYFFITNYPDTAKFLKPAERSFIHKRLAADSDATENEGFTWANVRAALADPKCWLVLQPTAPEPLNKH